MDNLTIRSLEDLPEPLNNQIGYPWTDYAPPQYIGHNLPKISIITPTFNQGNYIEETIRSVLLQGYPNLEYIIIDGGSTDNTIEVIKKYEKWISYWVSKPDDGQSHAINKGLARATGDIFNWLNSDDVYLPNTLLTIGAYFLDKSINVLCGREYLWYPNGQKVLTEGTIICPSLEETIAVGHIQQPPTFFRLPIVQQLGGIETNLHFCMDAELWVNYLIHFGLEGIKKIDLITNLFRMHETAKTANLRSVYFREKFSILISLFYSIQNIDLPKNLSYSPIYFSKHYDLASFIDKKRFAIYISEMLLDISIQYLSWLSVFKLYCFVLKNKPLSQDWRFYAVPLIKIKRLFQPL